jgi:CRP/FNR family transcriptional regulator
MTTNSKVRTLPTRHGVPAYSTWVLASGEIAQCKTVCSTCNLRELCVPCCGLTRSEKDVAAGLVFHRSRVRRGECLYRAGDHFTSLYAVRDGFFKSVAVVENGRDQVTGFSMPGELLGIDGIGPERHTCNAIALEDSEVCAIPFAALQALAQRIPGLQRHFYKMMSREITREHGLILQLGSMNAEERLAMFLLDLSQRFAARGFSHAEFHLRMTREEIGSYLGLKLETVSRTFSRFQEEQLICVRQKFIRILNSASLERVMGRELG